MTAFGPDPVAAEVTRVLTRLESGHFDQKDLESKHLDLKEEAGVRAGQVGPGAAARNEIAAKALAAEAACMANTGGGGSLLVGIADDGTVLGAQLDAEWLRRRIYDLTQRQLTVTVVERELRGLRILELRCPEALEPIRVQNKITWRIDDACVEIDAASWHDRRYRHIGYDWSAQASGHPVDRARPAALERAREYLRSSQEEKSLDLADATDPDLLTRLNVVTSDGKFLTNAGAIAFVGRPEPALDYIRRDVSGGDSQIRIRRGDRGLLEELYDIEQAISSANSIVHMPDGLVAGQVRQLPEGAIRESIVNGCAHRDWASPESTLVEHTGGTLVVTSPGGFVGGVTPQNIITHPSEPRHRALAELLGTLRVAEREGIGVDRMVRDMVRLGYHQPEIEEVPGPFVRAALVGHRVDEGWLRFLTQLVPRTAGRDLNSLLIIKQAIEQEWLDVATLRPVLQRSTVETEAAIAEASTIRVRDSALLEPVDGFPAGSEPAWHLTLTAWMTLAEQDVRAGQVRKRVARADVALSYARQRGRISTTELGSIVGADPTNVGTVLKRLTSEGLLEPSRSNPRGPGFFYRPTASTPAG